MSGLLRKPSLTLPSDEPVLLGLSGGKDSTGLAVWAITTYPDIDWHLVHVRHGLRDDGLDASIARCTAEGLGRPFHLLQADWGLVGGGKRHEAAARTVRYKAFEQIAERLGAHHLILGHHLEDQAETILLRLVRGTGPNGMAGMKPIMVRGRLIIHRPLLFWEKARIHSYIQNYPTVEDPTNADLTQRRSWIRHQVLPLLAYGRPDGQDSTTAIGRFTQLQAEQLALLDELLKPYRGPSWGSIQRIDDGLGPRITRQLIYEALGFEVEYAMVERIEDLKVGDRVDIAGGRFAARDAFGWVVAPREPQEWAIISLPTDQAVGKEMAVQRAKGWKGSKFQMKPLVDPLRHYSLPFTLSIPLHENPMGLRVRFRKPQDSSLADLFQRFPRAIRPYLPMVETEKGKILSVGPFSTYTDGPSDCANRYVALVPRNLVP